MSFRPIIPQNSYGQNIGQLNDMIRDLNREQVTKTFKGPGGYNAILQGKLAANQYGTIYSDATHRRILIGQDPDGNINIHVSKVGYDVVDLF